MKIVFSICKIITFLSYHQKFFEFFFVIKMKFTISANKSDYFTNFLSKIGKSFCTFNSFS